MGKTLFKEKQSSAPALQAEPVIFTYEDFRPYLKDWFAWKKASHSSFSGAVFAKMAGLSSHTLLGMVIRGERGLSHASIRAFTRALKLQGREAMFFEKLVLFNGAKNDLDRSFYLDQLVTLSKGRSNQLHQLHHYTQYLSHWYVVAIREMVDLPDFQAAPEWIAKKLKNKITKKQAEEAWEIILELGLVKLNPKTRRFETQHPYIDIDIRSVDFAVRNYQKQLLDRTKDAIDDEPQEDREISCLTLRSQKKISREYEKRFPNFAKQSTSSLHVRADLRPQALITLLLLTANF